MSKPSDGGFAFPASLAVSPTDVLYRSDDHSEHAGMSLRAYFAGRALPEKIRDAEAFNDEQRKNGSSGHRITPEDVANSCCRYADALLAELEKETP